MGVSKSIFGVLVAILLLGTIILLSSCILPEIHTIKPSISSPEQQGNAINTTKTMTTNTPRVVEKVKPIAEITAPGHIDGCFDSEYGRNYEVRGKCFDEKTHVDGIADYCIDADFLNEFYCSNDPINGCFEEKAYCENGCKEGECVTVPAMIPLQ